MMETLVPSKKITARQIKDEKQLSGLTDSVQLISDKFHDRKGRKAKLYIQVDDQTNIPGEIVL